MERSLALFLKILLTKLYAGYVKTLLTPKKIVIIDREIAHNLIVDMLYDCTLIPMTEVKIPRQERCTFPASSQ